MVLSHLMTLGQGVTWAYAKFHLAHHVTSCLYTHEHDMFNVSSLSNSTARHARTVRCTTLGASYSWTCHFASGIWALQLPNMGHEPMPACNNQA